MKSSLLLKKDPWQDKNDDYEMQINELFRNYNISTELIRQTNNQDELLDMILKEYIDRFNELPGVDFVDFEDLEEGWPVKEKLRSLIRFATQAALLKEKSEMFRRLEISNRQLNEATQKLNQKNKKLVEINKQYLNMLGFVSHELRSPLISVLGFAELLSEEVIGTLNAEQKKATNVIIRSSNSLIEMIQNYLELAKIEQGEMMLEKKPVDLFHDVLLPILEEMSELFEKNEISVFVESDKMLSSVFCDPRLIRVVLNNLLANAVKYGDEGGEILVHFVTENDPLKVSVTNTGDGLKKQDIKKIFQKFSQVEDTITHAGKSSGLGLYNAKYIVKKHGGEIWAESEVGKWFRVNFTLPVLNMNE
ncbi:MAG TPA: HAMP domain-containing histidine kinase [Bacteroidetes bacterium]|nr:HAMP domain-containing histidine kinase [Bacteroidota bacterium]